MEKNTYEIYIDAKSCIKKKEILHTMVLYMVVYLTQPMCTWMLPELWKSPYTVVDPNLASIKWMKQAEYFNPLLLILH